MMNQIWKKALWAALLTAVFALNVGCSDQDETPADSSSVSSSVQDSTDSDITATSESAYTYTVNDDGTISITGYSGDETNLELPATLDGYVVSAIADHAFEANWDMVSITMPNGLTSIGESAFMDCTALTTVSIPETVSEIRRAAFAGCTSLASVTLPETVSTVQEEAFTGCTALTQLTIWNTALEYEHWGLIESGEPLNVTIFCPSDSAVGTWAQENGVALQEIY